MEGEGGISSREVGLAKCECCGLTEECTEAYIKRVRDRYSGHWICGLCAEAVKDELLRSDEMMAALNQHMSFCNKFRALPKNPTQELISAVKQLLLRSFDSPARRRERPVSARPVNSSKQIPKSHTLVMQ